MTWITKLQLEATKFHNVNPGNDVKNFLLNSASARFIAITITSIVLRDGYEIGLPKILDLIKTLI